MVKRILKTKFKIFIMVKVKIQNKMSMREKAILYKRK